MTRMESNGAHPFLTNELVEAQRELILDPHDPLICQKARQDGIHESIIEAARKSPVYRFVKEWRLALPLHPEARTLPMLYYVPPLLPVAATMEEGKYELGDDLFVDQATGRLPLRYFAALFAAGNEAPVRAVFRKLLAVRLLRRSETVGDIPEEVVQRVLNESGSTPQEAEAIYRMTSLATFAERHVVPRSRGKWLSRPRPTRLSGKNRLDLASAAHQNAVGNCLEFV